MCMTLIALECVTSIYVIGFNYSALEFSYHIPPVFYFDVRLQWDRITFREIIRQENTLIISKRYLEASGKRVIFIKLWPPHS